MDCLKKSQNIDYRLSLQTFAVSAAAVAAVISYLTFEFGSIGQQQFASLLSSGRPGLKMIILYNRKIFHHNLSSLLLFLRKI